METYQYQWVDDYENVKGTIEAYDISHAALLIAIECGTEPGKPRWKRYGIKEHRIAGIPRDTELVIFSRMNEYVLEVKKVGSRKRKPLRLFA